MSDEPVGRSSIAPTGIRLDVATLLSQIPQTDPAILQSMEDARISARHYSAIGRVAAGWAYFEADIDTWLWVLIDLPAKIAVCLTAQMMGSRPRLDAFIALVRQLGANKRWNDDLERFAKDATGLSEQRNRAIHDIWDLKEPTQPLRREASAKRTVRLIDVHVPTQELMELVKNIQALTERFDELASSIFFELQSLPDKSPPDTPPASHIPHPQDNSPSAPQLPPSASQA